MRFSDDFFAGIIIMYDLPVLYALVRLGSLPTADRRISHMRLLANFVCEEKIEINTKNRTHINLSRVGIFLYIKL